MALQQMDLVVRNMVCDRCVRVIREELSASGIEISAMTLGQLSVTFDDSLHSLEEISGLLSANGFELVREEEQILVERIKVCLRAELDRLVKSEQRTNLSEMLTASLGLGYGRISKTFSRIEGTTIERYFILLKVEKVKELIQYGELSLKEIAFRLGYSSLQHLSGQFRQMTGMSMSDYRSLGPPSRFGLDKIV